MTNEIAGNISCHRGMARTVALQNFSSENVKVIELDF